MTLEKIENILDTYSFEEILEMNGLTEADILYLLFNSGDVELPEPEPL